MLLKRTDGKIERLIDLRMDLMPLHLSTYRTSDESLRLTDPSDWCYLLLRLLLLLLRLLLLLMYGTRSAPPLMTTLDRSPGFNGIVICRTGLFLFLLLLYLLVGLLLLCHRNLH